MIVTFGRRGRSGPKGGITYDIPIPKYIRKPGAGKQTSWASEMAKEMKVGASRYFDELGEAQVLRHAIMRLGGHAVFRAEGKGTRIWRAE
jgi:hypothetical protein